MIFTFFRPEDKTKISVTWFTSPSDQPRERGEEEVRNNETELVLILSYKALAEERPPNTSPSSALFA